MFDLEFDENNMKKVEKMMKNAPDRVPNAVANTLNETAKYTKRVTPAQITKKYRAFTGDVTKSLKIVKANSSRLEARVDSSSAPTPLIYFKTTPRAPVQRMPVTTEVKAGESHNLTKTYFTSRMKSGHVGVFRRVTKASDYNGRLPIKQLYGPSVPQMFGNEEVIEVITEKTANEMENKMIQEVAKEILR